MITSSPAWTASQMAVRRSFSPFGRSGEARDSPEVVAQFKKWLAVVAVLKIVAQCLGVELCGAEGLVGRLEHLPDM